MGNLLTTKLQNFCSFSDGEVSALSALVGEGRRVEARRDFAHAGDTPKNIFVILEGSACRYKQLEDGRRQIIALLLPGDICDLDALVLQRFDHSMGALSGLRLASIEPGALEQLMLDSPRLRRALLWHENVSLATQREWTLNVGQRTAVERVGHLLLEVFYRLRSVGLTQGNSCDFLLTQNDIAEATGLTPVHVNRMLQELRGQGFITLSGRRLTIGNLAALEQVSTFNSDYLHLNHEGAAFDAPTPSRSAQVH